MGIQRGYKGKERYIRGRTGINSGGGSSLWLEVEYLGERRTSIVRSKKGGESCALMKGREE